MGMYYYVTIRLSVKPDAPEYVHELITRTCDRHANSDDFDCFLSDLSTKYPEFSSDFLPRSHAMWEDIFGNWAGVGSCWAWNDDDELSEYVDGKLSVRCSYKRVADYKLFVDWITPWLEPDPDNCLFYWYEEYAYPEHAPSIGYGTLEAVKKLAPNFQQDSSDFLF